MSRPKCIIGDWPNVRPRGCTTKRGVVLSESIKDTDTKGIKDTDTDTKRKQTIPAAVERFKDARRRFQERVEAIKAMPREDIEAAIKALQNVIKS